MRRVCNQIPCYADGRPYFGLHAAYSDLSRPRNCGQDHVISLSSPALGWARFWQIISSELIRHGYSPATTQLYRSVLRNFYRHARGGPAATDTRTIRAYLNSLVREHASWGWLAMNISVLRTVFDKLGGKSITSQFVTPKRPMHLPEILSPNEVHQILAAAPSTRDQLLLGLM